MRLLPASVILPFGLLQVTQVLVGHILLPPLVHLLRRESLYAIKDGCRERKSRTLTQINAENVALLLGFFLCLRVFFSASENAHVRLVGNPIALSFNAMKKKVAQGVILNKSPHYSCETL